MKTKGKLSNFGLGTVQFGLDYGFTKRKTQEEVNDILNVAVENDVTLIDTAREYGDSEKKIGEFINQYDNNFIIATKLSLIDDLNNLNYSFLNNHIQASIEESLSDLNLDKIPILLLHQVDERLYKNDDFWACIANLKKDNQICDFGVSVYDTDFTKSIIEMHGNIIDYLQIPYNIFDKRFDCLFDEFEKYNIDVISRSTFLKGIIPSSIEDVPDELYEIIPYKVKLNEVCDKLNISTAELATLFVYYNQNISSTIFGVNSPQELETNIKTINEFEKDVLNNVDFDDLTISDSRLIDPRQWNEF